MAGDDVAISVQVLGGTWETFGADRLAGIQPDYNSLDMSSNTWGSDKASFNLYRDTRAIWPDLVAYTPIKISVAGSLVWSGRMVDTPTDDTNRTFNVQAEGDQYHLDDDSYSKVYVHSQLTDFVDSRSLGTTILSVSSQGWNVSTDSTGISLGVSNGTAIASGTIGGVTLDLGQGNTATRVVVGWNGSNNSGTAVSFRARFSNSPQPSILGQDVINFTNNSGASGTSSGNIFGSQPPSRYLHLFLLANVAFTSSPDTWFQITSCNVFGSNAYESGGVSILKASDVIKDALSEAPLISADQSQIASTTFNIPDFTIPAESPQTPRQAWDAVNAFHNWVSMVDTNTKPVFKPRPTTPRYEVGAWSGSEFTDASANSKEGVFNKATVTGQDATGAVVAIPTAAVQAVPLSDLSRVTTGTFSITSLAPIDTGIVVMSSADPLNHRPVRFTFSLTSITGTITGYARFGNITAGDYIQFDFLNAGTGTAFDGAWIPGATYSQYEMDINVQLASTNGPGNNFQFAMSAYTSLRLPLDRRNLIVSQTLPISAPLTAGVANQIGPTWLGAHLTTPFKGALTARGMTGVRDRLTGGPVHPANMLTETNELLHFSDRVDPTTGRQGRNGTIANVRYNHAERASAIDIDYGTQNVEAFLARLNLITSLATGSG